MKLKDYKNIYFVGIGGIGMSAIARYFNNKNINIFGYDRVKSSLCIELENEGMKIHYTEDTNQISVKKEDTLVIYTPAIPSENTELSYFIKNNYIVMKRSEVLGKITEDHFVILRYQGESTGCPEMLTPTSALVGYFNGRNKENKIPPFATISSSIDD